MTLKLSTAQHPLRIPADGIELSADLLTPQEEAVDERTRQLRFDIGLLARRLVQAADWLARIPRRRSCPSAASAPAPAPAWCWSGA
jgi:hypothetical protein